VSEDRETNDAAISIRSVVLATDLLDSSRLALDYAAAFTHRYGAILTIVHAFELSTEAQEVELLAHRPSVSREYLLSRLEALATGVRRLGIRTEIDLREGEACASVLSSVAENKADLLVLGTHGIYRGLGHLLIGSYAEKILLSAPCPALMVGPHVVAGIDLDLNLSKILLVSDTSPESAAATRYATSLGQSLGLEIVVVPVSIDVGAPNAQKVIEHAIACAVGLLIIGVGNESAWKRHLHASFAFELIAKSACPVLSIHKE
jgi:nucleotide-binding universal stress UspA family protein